jgi:hypothetical protein
MFNSYDDYKLDNGESSSFEEDLNVTVTGTDENISEFEKRFNEMVSDLAKECGVDVK